MKMLLLLTLWLVFPLHAYAAESRSMVVDDPGEGNNVLYMQPVPHEVLGSYWDVLAINVSSSLPVSVLMYSDSIYYEDEEPIGTNMIYVIVKSNCSESLGSPFVEYKAFDENSGHGKVSGSITIASNTSGDETGLDESWFLASSSFSANWTYSYACSFYESMFPTAQQSGHPSGEQTSQKPSFQPSEQQSDEQSSQQPSFSPSEQPLGQMNKQPSTTQRPSDPHGSMLPTSQQSEQRSDEQSSQQPSFPPSEQPLGQMNKQPSTTQRPSEPHGSMLPTSQQSEQRSDEQSSQQPSFPPSEQQDKERSGEEKQLLPNRLQLIVSAVVTGILTLSFLYSIDQGRDLSLKCGRYALCFTLLGFSIVLLIMQRKPTAEYSKGRNRFVDNANPVPSSQMHRFLDLNAHTCYSNVEILLNGCRGGYWKENRTIVFHVSAPALRILDTTNLVETGGSQGKEPCDWDYKAMISFSSSDNNTMLSSDMFPVPSLPYEKCQRWIEGRPFVEANGRRIQAVVERQESREPQAYWSNSKFNTSTPHSQTDTLKPIDHFLGEEWTKRALGEHASIASFASFTIALMSNNAPPDLIQDSLAAAMDEVNHARTSFAMASLLLGETVEPGPLPSSVLEFGANLTSLGLATAKEGCIDETLSALLAAFEADVGIDLNDRIDSATKALLKDATRTIALEESRHSALAWRTIQWICETDAESCSVVKSRVLHEESLNHEFGVRFRHYRGLANLDDAVDSWGKMSRALLSSIAKASTGAETDIYCVEEVARQALLEEKRTGLPESLVNEVVESIIRKALC